MRRKLVVGNWKMYGSLANNKKLLDELVLRLAPLKSADYGLCVPHPYLFQAQALLQAATLPGVGKTSASNRRSLHWRCFREMLTVLDVLMQLSHSKRRALFVNPTSRLRQFGAALKLELLRVLCW